MATPIKPSIYDTTHFNHEVTALNRKNPFSTGITTSIPDGLTDIVYEVKFRLIGIHTDSSSNTYSGHVDSQIGLEVPTSTENFVGFTSLTENTVWDWIKDKEPIIHHEYTVCNNIMQTMETNDESVPW